MRCMSDPNVVRLFGVCSVGEPLCVVTEYPPHWDLKTFLQQHVAQESSLARQHNANTLRSVLIYFYFFFLS